MNVIPTITNELLAAFRIDPRGLFAPEPRVVGFGTMRFFATVFGFEF